MKSNPAWVDRTMRKRWAAVEAEVGPRLMPQTSVGRMVEYGCGHYGCVLPVSEGCVLKITTDRSEAAFVAAAMAFGGWPPGIVEYYAALGLPDRYDGKPIFLLWREEAYEVGALVGVTDPTRHVRYPYYEHEFGRRPVMAFVDTLMDFRDEADEIFELLSHQRDKADFLDKVELEQARVTAGMKRSHDVAGHASFHVTQCMRYAKAMTRMPFGSSIGEALAFYVERGMALADVHLGNIGEVRDDPVDEDGWDLAIIDPGVMVPLSPEWLSVKVPAIKRT